jgi:hypothetical protein
MGEVEREKEGWITGPKIQLDRRKEFSFPAVHQDDYIF